MPIDQIEKREKLAWKTVTSFLVAVTIVVVAWAKTNRISVKFKIR